MENYEYKNQCKKCEMNLHLFPYFKTLWYEFGRHLQNARMFIIYKMAVIQMSESFYYTPPHTHTKWHGIWYVIPFEKLCIRLSACPQWFPNDNFRRYSKIFFKLCIFIEYDKIQIKFDCIFYVKVTAILSCFYPQKCLMNCTGS